MTTQHLRQIRSENAKKRGLGGDRTNKHIIPNDELELKIKSLQDNIADGKFIGPFNGKCTTLTGIKRDIARNLFKEQKTKFLKSLILVLNGNANKCKYCSSETEFDGKKFGLYCSKCYEDRIFNTRAMITHEQQSSKNKKISEKNKAFEVTERGKQLRKIRGEENSKKLKDFFKTEKGKLQIEKSANLVSKILREKIATGRFSPCITNSYTHWSAVIFISGEIKRFRSSWEACFFLCNQHLAYEILRIPYNDKDGESRSYIADFYDVENKILYEIKPKSQWLNANDKMQSVISYCIDNNIKFIWINENNIMEYIDESLFTDENLKQLEKMKRGIDK